MKDFEDLFATFIYTIYNKSLLDGTFPEDLETTEVVSVYKKKNRIDKSYYRPVSILLNTVKAVYSRHRRFLKTCLLYCIRFWIFRAKKLTTTEIKMEDFFYTMPVNIILKSKETSNITLFLIFELDLLNIFN